MEQSKRDQIQAAIAEGLAELIASRKTLGRSTDLSDPSVARDAINNLTMIVMETVEVYP